MKILEVGINKNYISKEFYLIESLNKVKIELEKSIIFKNLNFNLPENDIKILNNQDVILLFIENMLLIAFKYQTKNKNFTIEEKNDKIYITLDGINKNELEKIYVIFYLIDNINIYSNIKEVGETISIGFYFKKTFNLIENENTQN